MIAPQGPFMKNAVQNRCNFKAVRLKVPSGDSSGVGSGPAYGDPPRNAERNPFTEVPDPLTVLARCAKSVSFARFWAASGWWGIGKGGERWWWKVGGGKER